MSAPKPDAAPRSQHTHIVTYYSCASCTLKFSSGQTEPLCSACAARPSAQPAAHKPPSDQGASDPPPSWALSLCQSVAELAKSSQATAAALDRLHSLPGPSKSPVRSRASTAPPSHRSSRDRAKKRPRSSSRSSAGSPARSSASPRISPSARRSRSPDSVSFSDADPVSDSEDTPNLSHMVDGLISAIADTFHLSDPGPTDPAVEVVFHRSSRRDRKTFHSHTEFDQLFTKNWKCPDKRFSKPKRMDVLYPFPPEQVTKWSSSPSVDPPVSRLAKHTTLPLASGASLKDSTDRRIEAFAKSAFEAIGSALLPVFASTWASRALSTWAQQLQDGILSGAPPTDLAAMAQQLQDVGQYLCSASLDAAGCAAFSMANMVAIRRCLWLRVWRADPASKRSLTGLPFEGSRLFGKQLDKIISAATGGKSTLLPQTRPRRQDIFRSFRPLPPSRDSSSSFHQNRQPPPSCPRSTWQPPSVC